MDRMTMRTDISSRRLKSLIVLENGQAAPRRLGDGHIAIEIGNEIAFDAAALDSFDVKGWQPAHYDLLVLCAAVEFADRRWKRPRVWSRSLHVTMPVLDVLTWNKPEVVAKLRETLRHLTGDNWHFTFTPATNKAPIGHRQIPLDFARSKTFAIAYSDGLDSRAVADLSGTREDALCVRVANSRQRRRQGDNFFNQIPFKVHGHRSQESSFRSRGFQFAMITAIVAHLTGITRIVVPESGQGALGPVLLPLYEIYADYRNHPAFFRHIERLVSTALDYRLNFTQPRLWSTKGQTLREFLKIPSKSRGDLTDTHSCWQKRRVVNSNGARKQCGLCAACLLRRMSMHAAEIEETAGTYVIESLAPPTASEALAVLPDPADRAIMIEYGSVGVRHLMQLAALAERPDDDLRVHASEIAAETNLIYEISLTNLRKLLSQHAHEWNTFLNAQGERSFLRTWLEGGRYGRA
jgi:7-cyano-7-deazaguanine synthase in queuosine biosynthesis